MDADGSDVQRLTDLPSADNHDWSPDGAQIVFVGGDESDEGILALRGAP